MRRIGRGSPVRWLVWLRGAWRLYRDPALPAWVKWLATAAGAAYLLWPLDLVPDWPVPWIGYLDDVTLISAMLALVSWLAPRKEAAHRRDAAPPEPATTRRDRRR